MKFDNTFIITDEKKFLYIGPDILKYVCRRITEPVGYPPEKLEGYDKVIFFIHKCEELDSQIRELLKSQMKITLPDEGMSVVVFKKNSFLYPLIFCWNNKENYNPTIDTIYDNQEISFRIIDDTPEISIDGQYIYGQKGELRDILVAFNEGGIKYFWNNGRAMPKPNFYTLLTGAPYEGWYDNNRLNDLNLGVNFFEYEFAALISDMADGPQIVEYKNKTLLIKKASMIIDEQKCSIFNVYNKENVSQRFAEVNQEYLNLCSFEGHMERNQYSSLNFSFLGNDLPILDIKRLIQKSCRTNMTVLLTGESGTGKTTMAKNIHLSSKRREKPFIAVNCAAISYSLIESELFGYDEGSFTGARKGGKKGYFELADGGTLFLDEISEIPYTLQGKLLEVIQTGTFFRVGGEKKIHSDFRLIAATNRSLEEMVKERTFREDLYYRINVFPIELPPLCMRKDSINYIIADMLPSICNRLGIPPVLVSMQAMEKIRNYSWPGNIRELGNVLEKAAVLCDDNFILGDDIDLPICKLEHKHTISLKEAKEELEKEMILRTLKKYNGERNKTASELGIGRTSLFEKMKKYNIEMKEVSE